MALDAEGKRAFIADAQGTVRVFLTADAKAVGEIRGNPPSIATRLEILAAEMAKPELAADLTSMKSSLKHWTAAAINTKALTTHREADESALAVEEIQLDFSHATAAVALQATALNAKRNERGQIVEQLKAGTLEPELAAEFEATLAVIDLKLATALAAFQKSEADALTLRVAVEQAAPLAHQKRLESISLRAAYAKALE